MRPAPSLSSSQAPLLENDPHILIRYDNPHHASPRGHVEMLETSTTTSDMIVAPSLITAYRAPSSQSIRRDTPCLQHDNNNNNNKNRNESSEFIPYPLMMIHRHDQHSEHENNNINNSAVVDLSIPCLSTGLACCQCVRTQEIAFTTEWGRFDKVLGPGFHCLFWPMDSIAGRLSLRIQQLNVTCETKTADDVFFHVTVVILFRVAVLRAYDAYYNVEPAGDARSLIQTRVLDVLRSMIPASMTMDRLFESQQDICDQVFCRLQHDMLESYGHEIIHVLVTDISPNEQVKAAMNKVNASRRLKQAASHKAEANKVTVVLQAQGQAESDHLQGIGMAQKRRAIAGGMQESIQMWTEMDVRIADPPDQKEIMDLLLVTQYLDMLTAVSSDHLQIYHGPAELQALRHAVRLEND